MHLARDLLKTFFCPGEFGVVTSFQNSENFSGRCFVITCSWKGVHVKCIATTYLRSTKQYVAQLLKFAPFIANGPSPLNVQNWDPDPKLNLTCGHPQNVSVEQGLKKFQGPKNLEWRQIKRTFAPTIRNTLRAPRVKTWGFEAKRPENSPEFCYEYCHGFFGAYFLQLAFLGA